MNNFYHEFVVGFNFWYVALPLLLFLAAFLGTRRYYLESGGIRIKKRGKRLSKIDFITVVLSDMVVTILVVIESSSGVIQFFTNMLAKDDSATWALIVAGGVLIIGVPYVVFILLAEAIRIGECYQLGYLTEKRKDATKIVTIGCCKRRRFDR